MNERIKELAEQASKDKDYGYPVTLEYTNRFAEKFARLIIKNCIGEVYPDTFKVDGVEPANLADAVSRIKQHFGV